jgi:hypothetical protein
MSFEDDLDDCPCGGKPGCHLCGGVGRVRKGALGFTLDSEAALGVHDIRLRSTRAGVKLRYRESYQWDGR